MVLVFVARTGIRGRKNGRGTQKAPELSLSLPPPRLHFVLSMCPSRWGHPLEHGWPVTEEVAALDLTKDSLVLNTWL